jgi:light-harvesting complex I chlorophyll a/b binding protein 1
MSAAENLPGATKPFGFFDPLGLSKEASEGDVIRWREAELKHGRVGMIATVGILVGETVEKNTPLFGDKIVGPAIYQFQEADAILYYFWAGVVALIAVIEGYSISTGWETIEMKAARDPEGKTGSQLAPGYINGDLGFDPLGLKPKDAEAFALMQTKEINNGRLAMIGAAGMLVQELINEKGIFENLGGPDIY